jgi:hypothetical protein
MEISVQLPPDSYKRMQEGVATGEESKQVVVYHLCKIPCKQGVFACTLQAPIPSTSRLWLQKPFWRSVLAPFTRRNGWGEMSQSSASSRVAPGSLAVHTCCAGTYGTYTQKTLWRFLGKDHTHNANGAQCSAIRFTRVTSTCRCVSWGLRDRHRETRPSRRHWPSGSYYTLKGKCWRK